MENVRRDLNCGFLSSNFDWYLSSWLPRLLRMVDVIVIEQIGQTSFAFFFFFC
jgi:hypothetical protein